MAAIRWILGKVILFLNFLFTPKLLVHRSPEAQAQVDQSTASLALYQFEACPFCVKVRRAIRRLGLNIELRDAQNNATYADELVKGGGQRQVPCLRIADSGSPVRWMYESSDIIEYLTSRYSKA